MKSTPQIQSLDYFQNVSTKNPYLALLCYLK